jgi:hypothetical protein
MLWKIQPMCRVINSKLRYFGISFYLLQPELVSPFFAISYVVYTMKWWLMPLPKCYTLRSQISFHNDCKENSALRKCECCNANVTRITCHGKDKMLR